MRVILAFVLLLSAMPLNAEVTLTQLTEWMEEALSTARDLPADERKQVAAGIYRSLADSAPSSSIKAALTAIAMRPQNAAAAHAFIRLIPHGCQVPFNREDCASYRATATDFLERVYRDHIGTRSDDALQWQSGLAEFLLYRGKVSEAADLQREVVAILRNDPYKRTLLALLERATGKPDALSEAILNCHGPELEEPAYPGNYCANVARSIASRALMVNGGSRAQLFADVMNGNYGPSKP